MKRTPVSSSNVVSIGYDPSLFLLEVEFRSGVYQYRGVDTKTYEALMAADSKGKFINQNIVGRFSFTKIS